MDRAITGILAACLYGVILYLLSYPMMVLWNTALVPAISVLNEVSWSQMFYMVLFALFTSLIVPTWSRHTSQ